MGSGSCPARQRCVPVCRENFLSAQPHRSDEVCRKATRGVALARECPPVPECVPAVYSRRPEARQSRQHTIPVCRDFLSKPSDGLEPSTPSLPCGPIRNCSHPTATVFACFRGFGADPTCHRLPPLATTGLHKGSILCCPRWLLGAGRHSRAPLGRSQRISPPLDPRRESPDRGLATSPSLGVCLSVTSWA
jgi:hypothetical protein